jgi:16S rRNA G966 N2-methylase RsmD
MKLGKSSFINENVPLLVQPDQSYLDIAKAIGIDVSKGYFDRIPKIEHYLSSGVQRDKHIKEYGFPILTKECLDTLSDFLKSKKCLDAGAGSGYLSYFLDQRGVVVTASEKFISGNGYGFKKIWKNDHAGDSLDLLPGDFDAVLLAWPPYESEFGMNVLTKMTKGQLLVYQGEGMGGCTGNDEMHESLKNDSLWEPFKRHF